VYSLADSRYQRFARLVEIHQDRLYTLACYMLRDRDSAGDVVQETLLKLWSNIDDVAEEKVDHWLRKVLRNACIDALRSRGAYEGRFVSNEEAIDLARGDLSPETELETKDLRRHVEAVLDRMNEPYRSILFLREMNGCSYEEIGRSLDLPMTTVKVYLHRARKMVRTSLKGLLSGDAYVA
jgi:RNA polymerase sigma factor (sigma-70 family)